MLRRTPQSTRTTIPCPLSTLFRSPAGIAALPATMLAATKSPLFIVLPPDLVEQAADIATEHGPDVIVRIVAANEFFGEVEGLQWMVETIDVDLVAKGVAALVAALEQRMFVRLHIVIAVKERERVV